MNIEDKRKERIHYLRDLKVGVFFEYADTMFIKITNAEIKNIFRIGAYDEVQTLSPSTPVKVLHAKVIITDM